MLDLGQHKFFKPVTIRGNEKVLGIRVEVVDLKHQATKTPLLIDNKSFVLLIYYFLNSIDALKQFW
jgi:hypothetical protein